MNRRRMLRNLNVVNGTFWLVLAGCSEPVATDSGRPSGAGGSAATTSTGGGFGGTGVTSGATTGTSGSTGAGGATGGQGGVHDAGPSDGSDSDIGTSTIGPGVLTRGFDLKRTGMNPFEKTLNPATVNPTSFGKLYCTMVDGQIYAQILYVPNVPMGAKGKRDTIYVATMNDNVYAFDALDTSGVALWQRKYTDGDAGITNVPSTDIGKASGCSGAYNDIRGGVGILSTPALDVANRTMYFVARTKEATRFVARLHAVSMVDGAELAGSPVEITATHAGTGAGSVGGLITFDPRTQNQRAALTLVNGIVYIAFASHCDEGPYHGWILGYDAKTLQQKIVYMDTPDGIQGGIWMAGMGPAVDDDGTFFLATGNGRNTMTSPQPGDMSFKGGESILHLAPAGSMLTVMDWFTPSTFNFLEQSDSDLGGCGTLLVPGTRMVLAAGKDGKIYVTDKGNLGHQTTNDSQAIQVLPVTPPGQNGLAPHIHGTPAHFNSTAGSFVYVMAEQDPLRQYRINGDKLEAFRLTTIRAPIDPTQPSGFTMPGGIVSISADGNDAEKGIVWVNMPIDGDANQKTVPGVLRAFRASDISAPELWNSQTDAANNAYGNYAKYNPATVYNGRVYVPTFSNQFCVYGLR